MIFDNTVDIQEKIETDGIGSGSDADWDTPREEDVSASVQKRTNLPEAREQVAGQGEVQYSWLCFLPRYDEGSERIVKESDKIKWNGMLHEINGKFKNSLHIILALQQPEEA